MITYGYEIVGQLVAEYSISIDRTNGTVKLTFDFEKRESAQHAYENSQRPTPPDSEQHVFDHELGHANDMNNDMVKEFNQSADDAEENAERFANTVDDEENSMSKEEAEKRVREIFDLPPKEDKKKK